MGTSAPNPLPCGCRLTWAKMPYGRPTPTSGHFAIVHCQLHSAAEAMLAACKALLAWNDQYGDDTTCLDAAVSLASRAVAAAEPPAPKGG